MKLTQAKYYLPFVQAAAEGKTIQHKHKGTSRWDDCQGLDTNIWFEAYDEYEYRIKPTSYRPWTSEEVPVGAITRAKNDLGGQKLMIIGVTINGVLLAGDTGSYDFANLCILREHSLDSGKTWLPCGVLVNE